MCHDAILKMQSYNTENLSYLDSNLGDLVNIKFNARIFFTNKFTTIGMAFWQGTHQCVFINKVQKRRLRMFRYATDIGHSTAGQGQKRPIQGQHMQSVAETQTIIVFADLFRKLLHT